MGKLQMDHEYEMKVILTKWADRRSQFDSPPQTWDAGIDPGLLCHVLFSVKPSAVYGYQWVLPRCHDCHVGMPHGRDKPDFTIV